ncbi:MAG: hypothetical protein J1E38_10455, partial [Paramuribaculum sp.]|nr:hypothetical protein [Paramuribaculum sp.]
GALHLTHSDKPQIATVLKRVALTFFIAFASATAAAAAIAFTVLVYRHFCRRSLVLVVSNSWFFFSRCPQTSRFLLAANSLPALSLSSFLG